MTEREAYIAFNLLPDVGAVTVAREVALHGSAVAAWEAWADKTDWCGHDPNWAHEIARAEKMGVTLVTLCDAAYPAALKSLTSPPLVLYVVGAVEALAAPGVALVGTRRPTPYGAHTATRLATDLAHAQRAVFSGLALGIDAAAHRGALLGQGLTVGVLGGALDRFYPKANTALAREIVDGGGAVVSEFPFGRPPDPQTFPQRNRVVAGLAQGVVAVEAPIKSGTLITCRLALDQGRPVMAVPGRIDTPAARGCLHLIREGATLVTSAEDILEAIDPFHAPQHAASISSCAPLPAPLAQDAAPPPKATRAAPAVAPERVISREEAAVLAVVTDAPQTLDALARATALPIAQLASVLVQLRLKGRVRQLPGNRVCRR